MSKPGTRIELPPEAEPARDFIEALVARHEALVARYEKRIAELEKQVAALSARNVKPTPRNSSVPPSSEHPHGKPPVVGKSEGENGDNRAGNARSGPNPTAARYRGFRRPAVAAIPPGYRSHRCRRHHSH